MVTDYFSAQFEAIGVSNQVTVTDESGLAPALAIAEHEVRELDLACSRLRDDSELAALNRDGGGPASPLLLDALQAALAAAASTDGLIDPTVGAAMRGLGYDRDFELIVRRGPGPAMQLSVELTGCIHPGSDAGVAADPGTPKRNDHLARSVRADGDLTARGGTALR